MPETATDIPNQKGSRAKKPRMNTVARRGRTRNSGSGGTRSQRVLERTLSRDGIRRGAYKLTSHHHTLRAWPIRFNYEFLIK